MKNQDISAIIGSTSRSTYLVTGFKELDEKIIGFKNQELTFITSFPGMGNTAFALSLVDNIAIKNSNSVLYFSLSQSRELLFANLLALMSEVSEIKIRLNELTYKEEEIVKDKIKLCQNANIFIDDTTEITTSEIRKKYLELTKENSIELVIIDCFDLLSVNQKSKGDVKYKPEMDEIFYALKKLALELNLPIVVLSNLNEKIKLQGYYKMPKFYHFTEVNAIEQFADNLILLHRPEYFEIDVDAEGNSLKNIAEIGILKNNSGETGSVFLRYDSKFRKFREFIGKEYYCRSNRSSVCSYYNNEEEDNV